MKKYFRLCLLCVFASSYVFAEDELKTLDLQAQAIAADIISYGVIQQDAWELSFEVGGEIQAILVNSGEQVTKGQVLARLDTALLRNQEQRLQTELAYTRKKLDKDRVLIAKGSISEERLDDREYEYKLRELELAQVRINLAKHQLQAPANGIILSRQLQHPRLIQAGEPLFVFKDTLTPWRVSVQLNSAEIRRIKPGDKAYVTLTDGAVLTGQVELIKRRANPQDSSQEVLITLDPLSQALSAGTRVNVRITPANTETGYWIPIAAFSQISNNSGNLLLLNPQKNSVEERRVRLEILRDGHFAVFEDLSGYEKLIVD